jgi:arginine decarboxylase
MVTMRPVPVPDQRAFPRLAGPERLGLRIAVASAIGRGRTPISSFDDALRRCGAHNYNLIPLSSVIPPGAEVVEARHEPAADEFGHRLYVVKAEARSAEPGAVVAAGIGWVQWRDGRGCFVEHHLEAGDQDCAAVEAALVDHLHLALEDLCAVREVIFDPARGGTRTAVARVDRLPTTALALAVYQAEGWR